MRFLAIGLAGERKQADDFPRRENGQRRLLTEIGKKQAEYLASQLDGIIHAPCESRVLTRTITPERQTAEILSKELARFGHDAQLIHCDQLQGNLRAATDEVCSQSTSSLVIAIVPVEVAVRLGSATAKRFGIDIQLSEVLHPGDLWLIDIIARGQQRIIRAQHPIGTM